MAIQNILDRQDPDPLEIFHADALGEALGGVLEQVPDPEWRSRLRRAVKSVGIEEAATSSLTVTSASGGSVALPATDENGRRDGTIGLAAMKLALDPVRGPLGPGPRPPRTPRGSTSSCPAQAAIGTTLRVSLATLPTSSTGPAAMVRVPSRRSLRAGTKAAWLNRHWQG